MKHQSRGNVFTTSRVSEDQVSCSTHTLVMSWDRSLLWLPCRLMDARCALPLGWQCSIKLYFKGSKCKQTDSLRIVHLTEMTHAWEKERADHLWKWTNTNWWWHLSEAHHLNGTAVWVNLRCRWWGTVFRCSYKEKDINSFIQKQIKVE